MLRGPCIWNPLALLGLQPHVEYDPQVEAQALPACHAEVVFPLPLCEQAQILSFVLCPAGS